MKISRTDSVPLVKRLRFQHLENHSCGSVFEKKQVLVALLPNKWNNEEIVEIQLDAGWRVKVQVIDFFWFLFLGYFKTERYSWIVRTIHFL